MTKNQSYVSEGQASLILESHSPICIRRFPLPITQSWSLESDMLEEGNFYNKQECGWLSWPGVAQPRSCLIELVKAAVVAFIYNKHARTGS